MRSALQSLVSIVTPMYNEAEHLAECIESVLAQRHDNWEYVLLDNCSRDGSLEIARTYASKDRRIRVCQNQEFLRAIRNHNTALSLISPASKYCKVIFGDDWIFPECLEQMVAVAEEHPSVCLVGAYGLEGERVICTGLPYPSRLVSGREICRKHLLDGLYVFGSATSVLYRADVVRGSHPLFNENNIHADTEACFALLKHGDFGFVHQALTFTRVRPRSLTAMSTDLHTEFPGMLQLLVAHGSDYLTPRELDLRLRRHVAEYYRFLGVSLIKRRSDRPFWEYHAKKLGESGVGFSRTRVAVAALRDITAAALNPKISLEKLLRISPRTAAVHHDCDRQATRLFHAKEIQ